MSSQEATVQEQLSNLLKEDGLSQEDLEIKQQKILMVISAQCALHTVINTQTQRDNIGTVCFALMLCLGTREEKEIRSRCLSFACM
jgi:hypothetical protein